LNLKSCCVLQDHYDDERDKPIVYNTTSDLQDQESKTTACKTKTVFFWSQTGLVLRSLLVITSTKEVVFSLA